MRELKKETDLVRELVSCFSSRGGTATSTGSLYASPGVKARWWLKVYFQMRSISCFQNKFSFLCYLTRRGPTGSVMGHRHGATQFKNLNCFVNPVNCVHLQMFAARVQMWCIECIQTPLWVKDVLCYKHWLNKNICYSKTSPQHLVSDHSKAVLW